jgi:hypothetical protein
MGQGRTVALPEASVPGIELDTLPGPRHTPLMFYLRGRF